jgi:hypothetical protein
VPEKFTGPLTTKLVLGGVGLVTVTFKLGVNAPELTEALTAVVPAATPVRTPVEETIVAYAGTLLT